LRKELLLASVRVKDHDRVRVVTIDRPESRNAVDRTTADKLAQVFDEFDHDDSTDVGVLTGAGGHFSSGADLKAIAEGSVNRIEPEGRGPLGVTRMKLSKPVIAAIEGYAVAGGLELALWCDLRVASGSSTLGVFCRRFGVPLVDMGTIRLPRLIGHGRAMDLILTGRAVDAVEALAIGLVNRIVPEGEAESAAVSMARELAAFPQECLRNDRLSAIEQWSLGDEDAMRNEVRRGLTTIESGETTTGASAFREGVGRHGGAVS
jgi:enoyl-CoA hydratase